MSKRKDKGTFRVTKSGSIEYRVPYYDEDGIRRVKSFTGKSKEECLDRYYEFVRKLDIKLIEIGRDDTISKIAAQKVHNDHIKNYTSESGYDRGLQIVRLIENEPIGQIPIRRVTEMMLDDYLADITGYSNSMIRKIYALLAASFDLAYDRGIIKNNFFDTKRIKCPKSRKKDKVVRGMTEEEQRLFVKTLIEHKVPYGRNTYKVQLLLELYTGMRMGEINALKPSDVNFKNGYIHVRATIARGLNSRNYYKKHPKTDAGVRDVPISEKAEELLRQAISEMKDNPLGLIFYDYNKDDVIATYQVGTFYRRICEKAGVPYYGQHALRHTFASRCIEAGVPALALKTWLGHTNIHITLDRYADVFDRMNSISVKKYDSYIDRIREEILTYSA